jgi:hypothetical protein
VTDDLELLLVEMARHQAHHHHCSLTEATRQIRALVAEAREEYHAAALRMATTITVSVVGCSQNLALRRVRSLPSS